MSRLATALLTLFVAMFVTPIVAASAASDPHAFAIKIMASGCIAQGKSEGKSKLYDPQGTTPPLAADAAVSFENDDSCTHCLTIDSIRQCVTAGGTTVFKLDQVGMFPVDDDQSDKEEYHSQPPEQIDIAQAAAPSPSPTSTPEASRSASPVPVPRVTTVIVERTIIETPVPAATKAIALSTSPSPTRVLSATTPSAPASESPTPSQTATPVAVSPPEASSGSSSGVPVLGYVGIGAVVLGIGGAVLLQRRRAR